MRRSELIRAIARLFEVGSGSTEIIVVVRMRERDGQSGGQVGAFGDVESPEVAKEMLRQAWMWVEREGRMVDSSGVILAVLAPTDGAPN